MPFHVSWNHPWIKYVYTCTYIFFNNSILSTNIQHWIWPWFWLLCHCWGYKENQGTLVTLYFISGLFYYIKNFRNSNCSKEPFFLLSLIFWWVSLAVSNSRGSLYPSLITLTEPSMNMNPLLFKNLFENIFFLKQKNSISEVQELSFDFQGIFCWD